MSSAIMREIRQFAVGYTLGKEQGTTDVMMFLDFLMNHNFDIVMLRNCINKIEEGKEKNGDT